MVIVFEPTEDEKVRLLNVQLLLPVGPKFLAAATF